MSSDDVWSSGPPAVVCSDITRAALDASLIGADVTSVVFHDLDLMEARLGALEEAFPSGTMHAVAIKANPLVEVLRTAVEAGAGLEAASIEEVEIALAAGCAPERIVFDSPAKTRAELERALSLSVMVNADNEVELERIAELRPPDSTSVVGIRVNPLVGGGRIPATSVAGATSKFGVPIDEVDERVYPLLERWPWIRAVHSHVGSQGCSLEQLVAAGRAVADLRMRWNERLGRPQLSIVDVGGGLPTTYTDDDVAIDPSDYANALRREAPSLFADDVRLVTEFGRVLQAHCGWAISRVEYVKQVTGEPMAVIHLGADLLLRVVYQPEHWRHRLGALAADGTMPEDEPSVATTVAGPLCFAGDVIARSAPLPPVSEGDWVVIHDVGAYTLSMWSRHCNRGLPLVLGHRRDGSGWSIATLREREEPAEVARFWSLGR